MVVYGYLRVSTEKQNIENEKTPILLKKDELKISGDINWITEIVTGKKSWRDRSLGNLFNMMKPNDHLFISEISRIERNMLGCMEFIAECSKKNINIYVCKGNFKIDTSIQSQMLIFAYSLSAQLERELISSRTKSGLAKAKEEGRLGGRPKGEAKHVKLDEHIMDIKKMYENGSSNAFIANKYKCDRHTVSKFIKRHKILRNK